MIEATVRALLVAVVFVAMSCAGRTELVARTALSTLSAAIDPAYSLATDACAAQDDALSRSAKATLESVDKVEVERAELGKRCEALLERFERMRILHTRAVEALEDGRVREAEQLAEQVSQVFRGARLRGPS